MKSPLPDPVSRVRGLAGLIGLRRRQWNWQALGIAGLLLLVLAPRLPLLATHPLWVDEVFSLAMATGHSLEHPASMADAVKGDYIEAPTALPAKHYQQYLEQDSLPAGLGRVLRAVFLSDTSPPLYYLTLWSWSLLAGTSDVALRGLSLLWTLLSLPLLWSIGRRMGGRRVAAIACVLMAMAPASVYYATEGRMYAMVWFLALAQAALTLRIRRTRRYHAATIALWVVTAAAGLLTHYFFAFVLSACTLWLFIYAGGRHRLRLPRYSVPLMLAAIGLLVLPWYLHVPQSLAAWRVTQGWLSQPWGDTSRLVAPARLFWSFFSVLGPWWGPWWYDRILFWVVVVSAALAVWRLNVRLLTPRRQLLWFWVAASCVGPLIFDLLRDTYASLVTRYALPGLPAALLLAAVMLGSRRIPWPVRTTLLILVLGCWLTATRHMLRNSYRVDSSPFTDLAERIENDYQRGDVVIVHSIPSGVLGMARYLPPEVPVVSWVGQLEQRRVPEDLPALIGGYRRVILVRAHTLDEPAPQRIWLNAHAEKIGPDWRYNQAWLTFYEPAEGGTFTFQQ